MQKKKNVAKMNINKKKMLKTVKKKKKKKETTKVNNGQNNKPLIFIPSSCIDLGTPLTINKTSAFLIFSCPKISGAMDFAILEYAFPS
jgi:hypothetical protein